MGGYTHFFRKGSGSALRWMVSVPYFVTYTYLGFIDVTVRNLGSSITVTFWYYSVPIRTWLIVSCAVATFQTSLFPWFFEAFVSDVKSGYPVIRKVRFQVGLSLCLCFKSGTLVSRIYDCGLFRDSLCRISPRGWTRQSVGRTCPIRFQRQISSFAARISLPWPFPIDPLVFHLLWLQTTILSYEFQRLQNIS